MNLKKIKNIKMITFSIITFLILLCYNVNVFCEDIELDITDSEAEAGTGTSGITNLYGGGFKSPIQVTQTLSMIIDGEVKEYTLGNTSYPLSDYKNLDIEVKLPDWENDSDIIKENIYEQISIDILGKTSNRLTDEDKSELDNVINNARKSGEMIVSRNMVINTANATGNTILYDKDGNKIGNINSKVGSGYTGEMLLETKLNPDGTTSESDILTILREGGYIKNSSDEWVMGRGNVANLVNALGKAQNIGAFIPELPPVEIEIPEDEKVPVEDPTYNPVVDIDEDDNSEIIISPNGCSWQQSCVATAYAKEPGIAYTGTNVTYIDCTCHLYCDTCGGDGSVTCETCYGDGGWPCSGKHPIAHDCEILECEEGCTGITEASCSEVGCSEWIYCSPYESCPNNDTIHDHKATGSKKWIARGPVTKSAPEGAYTLSFEVPFDFVEYNPEPITGEISVDDPTPRFSKGRVSQIYYIDSVKPIVDLYGNFDSWYNSEVSYSTSANDPNPYGVNQVSGVNYSTLVPGSGGKISREGITSITASVSDYAGNVSNPVSKSAYIDYTSPVISYKIVYDNVIYNENKNRWETSKSITPYFLLKVYDPVPSGVNSVSGLSWVKYELYNDTTKQYDENATPSNSINVSSLSSSSYYKIDIPSELLKEGGNIYLDVIAQDRAGNYSITIKDMLLGDDKNKDQIIPDNIIIYSKEQGKYPIGNVFVNSPDIDRWRCGTSIYITNVNDVKWKNSFKSDVSPKSMAVYMNNLNDTIGLGYMVGFKYKQFGYGTDIGDKVELKVKLYGKVGNDYKLLDTVKVNNEKYDECFSKTMIRSNANTDNTITSALQMSLNNYCYNTDDNKSMLLFNYYIPTTAKFYYKNGSSEVEYKGNDVLVIFDINSYKWYDISNKKFVYNFASDNDIQWNTINEISTSYYGKMRMINVLPKGQVFWYDIQNTAVDDIQGNRN